MKWILPNSYGKLSLNLGEATTFSVHVCLFGGFAEELAMAYIALSTIDVCLGQLDFFVFFFVVVFFASSISRKWY